MRITGGIYRGRELASPKNQTTHPMGSRERLALFNSLAPSLPDAEVLDAYAGTGALGLEALSRGAAHATFIEKDHRAAKTLRQNLTALQITDQATILETPVSKASVSGQFDLIFADPPYDHLAPDELASLAQFLKPNGQLIISHPATFRPAEFATITGLSHRSTKSYAACNISIFVAP